jgi:hypothetical protein
MSTKAKLQVQIIAQSEEIKAQGGAIEVLRIAVQNLIADYHREPPPEFVSLEQVQVWRSDIEEFHRDTAGFNERVGLRVAHLENAVNKLSGDIHWHDKAFKLLGLKGRKK